MPAKAKGTGSDWLEAACSSVEYRELQLQVTDLFIQTPNSAAAKARLLIACIFMRGVMEKCKDKVGGHCSSLRSLGL
jgi:hypothetical protein